MLKRTDLNDDRDPNPDKDQQYQQPERKTVELTDRSFAGENFAAAERQQAEMRNSGPPSRGNNTDDVQASDRTAPAFFEGDVNLPDRAERVNSARTGLDAERREETDENL